MKKITVSEAVKKGLKLFRKEFATKEGRSPSKDEIKAFKEAFKKEVYS